MFKVQSLTPMRFLFLFLGISFIACSSTRPSGDYTVNRSRTADKRTVRKVKPLPNTARTSLVDYAESLVGSRYKYGGNSPREGFDCSGFTCYVMRNADIVLPRTSTDQSRIGRRKQVEDADPGDLIFFGHGSRVTHVAIVVRNTRGKLEVVHSTSSRGVVRDEIHGSEYWRKRTLWAVDLADIN